MLVEPPNSFTEPDGHPWLRGDDGWWRCSCDPEIEWSWEEVLEDLTQRDKMLGRSR